MVLGEFGDIALLEVDARGERKVNGSLSALPLVFEDLTENGRPISEKRDHWIAGLEDGKLAIDVSTSNPREQLTPAAGVQHGTPREIHPSQKYSIPLNTIEARYLKIRVKNYGKCPDWLSSAGGAAWMFVDEIFVE